MTSPTTIPGSTPSRPASERWARPLASSATAAQRSAGHRRSATAGTSAWVRGLVAEIQAQAGDLAGAEQTIDSLQGREQYDAMGRIALGRARAGDPKPMLARLTKSPVEQLIWAAGDLLRIRRYIIDSREPFDGFTT